MLVSLPASSLRTCSLLLPPLADFLCQACERESGEQPPSPAGRPAGLVCTWRRGQRAARSPALHLLLLIARIRSRFADSLCHVSRNHRSSRLAQRLVLDPRLLALPWLSHKSAMVVKGKKRKGEAKRWRKNSTTTELERKTDGDEGREVRR
eukprot:728948-Hanusia_phi.AAC.1